MSQYLVEEPDIAPGHGLGGEALGYGAPHQIDVHGSGQGEADAGGYALSVAVYG